MIHVLSQTKVKLFLWQGVNVCMCLCSCMSLDMCAFFSFWALCLGWHPDTRAIMWVCLFVLCCVFVVFVLSACVCAVYLCLCCVLVFAQTALNTAPVLTSWHLHNVSRWLCQPPVTTVSARPATRLRWWLWLFFLIASILIPTILMMFMSHSAPEQATPLKTLPVLPTATTVCGFVTLATMISWFVLPQDILCIQVLRFICAECWNFPPEHVVCCHARKIKRSRCSFPLQCAHTNTAPDFLFCFESSFVPDCVCVFLCPFFRCHVKMKHSYLWQI